jgi:hypothetical protein
VSQWRYYAGLGLFAAVVSLISGIAGGNPLGVVLLRMLLSALLLAGLGMGCAVLLKKFLPELMQRSGGETAADGTAAVDIVIPEENPHEMAAAGVDEETEDAEPLEELIEDAGEPETSFAAAPESAFPAAPAAAPAGPAAPAAEAAADEDAEDAEEAIPLEEEAFSVEGSADVDTLPDLEQFDSTNYVGPDISGLGRGGDDFAQAQVDGIMSSEDPAQLAKAVRTFLKKDQEG